MNQQAKLIKIILKALLKLNNEKYYNESTFKNNLFSYLKNRITNYNIFSDYYVKKLVSKSGFFDFYITRKIKRSYMEDIALEIKFNSENKNEIKKDVIKLNKFSKIHKKAKGIFINVFTKPIYCHSLYEMGKFFHSKDIFVIFVLYRGFRNFTYIKGNKIIEFDTNKITFVFNSRHFHTWFDKISGRLKIPYEKRNAIFVMKYPNREKHAKNFKLHYGSSYCVDYYEPKSYEWDNIKLMYKLYGYSSK